MTVARPIRYLTFAFYLTLGVLLLGNGLAATYYGDDFLLLSIIQAIHNPLDFWTKRTFFTQYVHRPIGLLTWWSLWRIHSSAWIQYAMNAVLLGLNGYLLHRMLRLLQTPWRVAAVASVLWIAHPGSVVTAHWLSDRFDLLASVFWLAALGRAIQHQTAVRKSSTFTTWGFVIAALFTKESSVVLVPMLCLIPWLYSPQQGAMNRTRVALKQVYPLSILILFFFGYRYWLELSVPEELITAATEVGLLSTVWKWWAHFPQYLGTLQVHRPDAFTNAASASTVAALIGSGLYSIKKMETHTELHRLLPQGLGAVLLLMMPVTQSVHFSLTEVTFLTDQWSISGNFTERYYFHGHLGLVLFCVGLWQVCVTPPDRARTANGRNKGGALPVTMAAGLLAVIVLNGRISSQWSDTTWEITRTAEKAAHAATALQPTDGTCRLRFTGASNPMFNAMTEVMVKTLAANVEVDRCIIESDVPQFISLTHRSRLAAYPLVKPAASLPNVAQWFYLQPTQHGTPNTAVTHAFQFDAARSNFAPAPCFTPTCGPSRP